MSLINDRESFLSAILAQPEEDLPRLTFADWLDDHSEAARPADLARAEFIRIQHERTQWGTCVSSPHSSKTPCPECSRRGAVTARMMELREKHEDAWRRVGPC